MPRSVMMYLRSLPRGTPKVHFSRFNLMLPSEVLEGFFKFEDEVAPLLRLYHIAINIDL
jgi:hypothetical protein